MNAFFYTLYWGRQIAGYGRRITNVDNRPEIVNDIHGINVFVLLIRVEEHLLHTKGRVDMTTSFDRLPTVTPASWIPGPGQGHWTYEHYAALPDDGKRYEIINGVLYMTPSPGRSHQEVALEFAAYLRAHVKSAHLRHLGIQQHEAEGLSRFLSLEHCIQPRLAAVHHHSFHVQVAKHLIQNAAIVNDEQ